MARSTPPAGCAAGARCADSPVMACAIGHELTGRLLAAVVTYDAVLRGVPLTPGRSRGAAYDLAEALVAAGDDARDRTGTPIREEVDRFAGALELSLLLARAATPADRRRAMALPEFVYRLAPLTAIRSLGPAWAAAARFAPPGVVAAAATRLPRPAADGSPSRTRLLALTALARAAHEARAQPHRWHGLVLAERAVDTLLPACPRSERVATVAALARARSQRRLLMPPPPAASRPAG